MNWKEENRISQEMLEQADGIEDLTQRQRFLQEAQTRATRLQTLQLQESIEGLRLSQIRLRVTVYASAAMFVAMIPILIVAVRHNRRQRWLRSGRCGECSYDLRAHSAGNVCPECGTAAKAAG